MNIIGVAVDSPQGLIVPVIKNADRISLSQIVDKLRTFREKINSTGLAQDDISLATFTITNLGKFGVRHFTPVINPPELAILGVGAVSSWPETGGRVRRTLPLSLTFDHRVLDGEEAARFLKTLHGVLENASFKELDS